MKFLSRLRKPDWEHRDAAVRRRAVTSSAAPELLARLAEIAQRDEDADVRIAALSRLDDMALLERRMRGDNEPRVAAAARARLLDCLCDAARPVDERATMLASFDDPAVLAAIAERAPEPALRRRALERIDRPGLLFERCLQDPSPEIRLWLLERIDGIEALQRLVQAARRRDKTLTRAARERLDRLQLAAGDHAAVERRVEQLCARLSQLARELPVGRDAQLAALGAEAAQLAAGADEDQRRRLDAFLALAADAIAAADAGGREPAHAAAEDATPAPAGEPSDAADAAAPVAVPDPAFDAFHAALPGIDAADFDARVAALIEQGRDRCAAQPDNPAVAAQQQALLQVIADLRRQREAQQAQLVAARRAAADAALVAIDTALREGATADARRMRSDLDPAALDRAQSRRLAALDAALAKLDHWQRWADRGARSRLCDEAEALHGSGLHPDALATRVKELQAEWARLDAVDGEHAPPADAGITRRFRALCQRALAPARPYFEKRRELRQQRAEDIDQLLAATEPGSADTVAAAVEQRRRITDALRGLDSIAPERRGELGRRLRERLAAIDDALAVQREQALAGKRRIIARLRRELGHAEPAAAIALARDAQAEWKRLPRAARADEDALWNELRGLIDPLFEAARAREQGERAQQAEAEAESRAVLDELDQLAAADPDRLAHADAHIDALSARWRSLAARAEPPAPMAGKGPRADARPRDRAGRDDADRGAGRDARRGPRSAHPLEGRFNAALDRVRAARQRAALARERADVDAVCRAAELLDRLPDLDGAEREAVRAEFAALPLPADARQVLEPRLHADGGAAGEPVAPELYAVRAELAAGIDSPPGDTALRRSEQMKRLAARLEGALVQAPTRQIREHLLAAAAASADPARRRAALERIAAAFAAAQAEAARAGGG